MMLRKGGESIRRNPAICEGRLRVELRWRSVENERNEVYVHQSSLVKSMINAKAMGLNCSEL
jgi:hypothetical protein